MAAVFLISLLLMQLYVSSCEIADSQKHTLNAIEDNDSRPFTVTANKIKGNLDDFLEDPLGSINIDYLNNAVILQFRRSIPIEENEVEAKRRSAVDKNFMRFGRSDQSRMRFGKRQPENAEEQRAISKDPKEFRYERSENDNQRNSRSDNFMRFGRSDKSLMRFGRSGEQSKDQERNFMRFGKSNNMMRFGRSDGRGFIRFGKRDGSLMRFGRADKDLNRAERGDGFMRFGRAPNELSEYDNVNFLDKLSSRAMLKPKIQRRDSSFMRFGKLDQNFMRFGKRSRAEESEDKVDLPSNDLEYLFKSNTEFPDDSSESKSNQVTFAENGLQDNGLGYKVY